MKIVIEVQDGNKNAYLLIFRGGSWWLENEEGEGFEMSNKNLFDMLDNEFQENF